MSALTIVVSFTTDGAKRAYGRVAVAMFGFDVRKSAQIAAFFAIKSGGSINVLKLMKLMYLSEREYVCRYDLPMLFDKLVSMDKGPALSATLNYINGLEESAEWEKYITDRARHNVGLSNESITIENLGELSDSEVEVLESIWVKFGALTQWDLVNYTHKNCPEWEDPDGSSQIIPYSRLLRYLGKEDAERIADEISSASYLASYLADAEYLHCK